MNLIELKENVDHLIENGYGKEEILITLSDNSIGGRACTKIKYISPGFDWESGQIRIEPEKKIVSYETNRDKVIEPRLSTYYTPNNKLKTILNCKKCDYKLKKDDIFCSRCGQKCKDIKKK